MRDDDQQYLLAQWPEHDILALLLSVLSQETSSPHVAAVWDHIGNKHALRPTVKEFKDVAYHSVASRGLSLQFEPQHPADREAWTCKAVDIYNENAQIKGWEAFPSLPLRLPMTPTNLDRAVKEAAVVLDRDTTGADLVTLLGEPTRKGGGEPLRGGGASGLGPPAWMEWNIKIAREAHILQNDAQKAKHESSRDDHKGDVMNVKLMIQLAGADARGAQRWEKDKGGAAKWGVATFYIR